MSARNAICTFETASGRWSDSIWIWALWGSICRVFLSEVSLLLAFFWSFWFQPKLQRLHDMEASGEQKGKHNFSDILLQTLASWKVFCVPFEARTLFLLLVAVVTGGGAACYFVGCAEESRLCGGGVVQSVLFEQKQVRNEPGEIFQGCEVQMRHLIRGVYAISTTSLLFGAVFRESVWVRRPSRLKVQKSDSLDWSDATVI